MSPTKKTAKATARVKFNDLNAKKNPRGGNDGGITAGIKIQSPYALKYGGGT